MVLQKYPAIFIIGIGWILKDGYPHEMRAADYDDWVTDTSKETGRPTHGLNGDVLVWNPVTKRRHELTSMGIRVTKELLRKQLEITGQLDFLKLPYHQSHPQRPNPVEHRRRHRPVEDLHVPAADGSPWRSQRHRVAETTQGHLRQAKHQRP